MEMIMNRELTCIGCPIGCGMSIEIEDDKIQNVKGNTCKRGLEYALSECTNPTRIVTSTVMSDDGRMISVKTNKPIPKEKIFECMKKINNSIAKPPVEIGDTIIKNVFGSDIIATVSVK